MELRIALRLKVVFDGDLAYFWVVREVQAVLLL